MSSKIFGSRTSGTAHYYAGYGDMTDKYWQEFSDEMNALPMDQDCCRRIIKAALDFFEQLEALFSSLYPIRKTQNCYIRRIC